MADLQFRIIPKRPPGGEASRSRACVVRMNDRVCGVIVLTDDEWDSLLSDVTDGTGPGLWFSEGD